MACRLLSTKIQAPFRPVIGDFLAISFGTERCAPVELLALSPAEFGKLIAEETEKWGKVIRAGNIKPE